MIFYAFCGLPGSGKTTLSRELALNYNAKLYCYDEFKKTFKAQERGQTHKNLYSQLKQDLLAGNDVILDDLHTCPRWRRNLLSAIQGVQCKKILIVMTTPFEECIRRNIQRKNGRLPDSIIYHLNSNYQPPSLEEGWDEILYY